MINVGLNANTDGIFFKVPNREMIDVVKEVASEWEKRTRLDLEWEEYTKIVQKDVNNFIMVEPDGGYKSKGAYLKKLSPIDSDLLIVNKALINYFLNGTPIETTIKSSGNLSDFQKIVKVSSLYQYALLGETKIKEKVLRVFASNKDDAPQLFKVKTEDRVEKIANTPDKCFIMNDDIEGVGIPDELDLNYYIELANIRLNDFFTGDRKTNTKPKSEIKGVNEEVYNDIIDLDFEKYNTFIDLLCHICDNGLANKTQVMILTKLNYFNRFGQNKKLSEVVFEFYDGEFKYGKNQALKTKAMKIEKLKEKEVSIKDEAFPLCEEIKIRQKYLGYFITNKEEDRPKLLITNTMDLKSKKTNRFFATSITATSIGSGKENKYTIMASELKTNGKVNEGDIIICYNWCMDRGFFKILNYNIIYKNIEE